MGSVKIINNKEDLAKLYANDHKKLVVLEFMVPWSELCKFMSPAVEELAKTYGNDADFYMLDTDKFKDHAREKGVEVLPTFLLLKDGKECKRIVDINKEELRSGIEEHKGEPDKGAPSVTPPTAQSEAHIIRAAPPRRRKLFMRRARGPRYPFFFGGR